MKDMQLVFGLNWAHRLAPHAGASAQGTASVGAVCNVCPRLVLCAACSLHKPAPALRTTCSMSALPLYYTVHMTSLEHTLHMVPEPDWPCALHPIQSTSLWASAEPVLDVAWRASLVQQILKFLLKRRKMQRTVAEFQPARGSRLLGAPHVPCFPPPKYWEAGAWGQRVRSKGHWVRTGH